jgi:hypothetical protein
MNIDKGLRIRVLFVALLFLSASGLFAQADAGSVNVEITDTIEAAEVLTIGNYGVEDDVLTSVPDTITTLTEDRTQVDRNEEEAVAPQDTVPVVPIAVQQVVVTADSLPKPVTVVSVDTTGFDYQTMHRKLKQYFYPPVQTGVSSDTLILPYLCLPPVYFEDRIKGLDPMPTVSYTPDYVPFEQRFRTGRFFSDLQGRKRIIDSAYIYIIDKRPDLVRHTISDFRGAVEQITEIERTELRDVFKIDYDLNKDALAATERYKPKVKYWSWKGGHYLQFAQQDNSRNWSDTTRTWKEKGLGAMNLTSVQSITGKYSKNKIVINHVTEWRLTLANSQNDSLRPIRIAEDRLRSYTDFGITAFKHWYYSSNLELTTPVLLNHRENTMDTLSSFLSPLKANLGVGMRYQLDKTYPKVRGKRLTVSADISVLSLQYVYVKDPILNPAQYIKDPKKDRDLYQIDLGSSVNTTLKYYFNKYVTLDSRFKYFTTYKKSSYELENTLNMPINRYLSMRIYLYLTYDDTRVWVPTFGHFVINESMGLTFNYTW